MIFDHFGYPCKKAYNLYGGPPAPGNSWSMLGNFFWAIKAAPQHTMTKYEVCFSITPSYMLSRFTITLFRLSPKIRRSCVLLTEPGPWRSLLVLVGNLFWAIRAAPQHRMTNCEAGFSITVGMTQNTTFTLI